METYTEEYLEALINALVPKGDVLQVGFTADFADAIQKHRPKSHTIIESDESKIDQWAKSHPHVSVIRDSWKNALPQLGIFDSILFHEEDQSDQGVQIVKEGEDLLEQITNAFPELSAQKYSNEDIDSFASQVGATNAFSRFLNELRKNNQISAGQYEQALKKHHLTQSENNSSANYAENAFLFLRDCIEKHMRKGSRFSWTSKSLVSKYEHPQFFEHIITNPTLEYTEEKISACKKPFIEALLMIVEKNYNSCLIRKIICLAAYNH